MAPPPGTLTAGPTHDGSPPPQLTGGAGTSPRADDDQSRDRQGPAQAGQRLPADVLELATATGRGSASDRTPRKSLVPICTTIRVPALIGTSARSLSRAPSSPDDTAWVGSPKICASRLGYARVGVVAQCPRVMLSPIRWQTSLPGAPAGAVGEARPGAAWPPGLAQPDHLSPFRSAGANPAPPTLRRATARWPSPGRPGPGGGTFAHPPARRDPRCRKHP